MAWDYLTKPKTNLANYSSVYGMMTGQSLGGNSYDYQDRGAFTTRSGETRYAPNSGYVSGGGGGGGTGGAGSAGGGYGSNYSSGGSSIAPFRQVYKGKIYTSADEFQDAVRTDSLEEYNRQKAILDRSYNEGLISYDDRMTQLGKARDSAMSNVQGFFGAIAPGVESSQETNFTNDVMAQYGQGSETMGRQKENWQADMLDDIARLRNEYESQNDQLSQGLLDYTKNTAPLNLPSEQQILSDFGKYNYTNQLYGNATRKTPAVKSTAKPFRFTTPIGTFLYQDGQAVRVA